MLYSPSYLKPEIKQFKIWTDHRNFIHMISVAEGFTAYSTSQRRVNSENLHRQLAPVWKTYLIWMLNEKS